jgi:hypothetical protein
MPNCSNCGTVMLPYSGFRWSLADLARLEGQSQVIHFVALVIWFVCAAIFSIFFPVAYAGVAGAIVAATVMVYLIHRNTTQFQCPNCGAYKQVPGHGN